MNLFTAHLTGITSQLLPVRAVRAGRTVTVTIGDGPPTNDPESNCQRETRIRVKCALGSTDTQVDVQVHSGKLHSACMDLAVAAAIYATEGGAKHLPPTLFLGELALSGAVRPIRGVLPHLRAAKAQGIQHVLVPESQVLEAAGLDLKVHPIADVSTLMTYLVAGPTQYIVPTLSALPYHDPHVDFADVRGLHDAVHACTLSAVTGYPILFEGPHGAGSTLLARRLPTILPDPTPEELLEIRTVQSASGSLGPDTHNARPFRAPHHTCSAAALFGGGPQGHQVPGELSRAAKGVLFLDDLSSFRADIVQALRQHVRKPTLRLYQGPELPCDAHLAASSRPCLCGLPGHPTRVCTCTPRQVAREKARVPKGMFPIRVRLPFPAGNALKLDRNPSSAELRERVVRARAQLESVAPMVGNHSQAAFDELAQASGLPRETVYNLLLANAYLNDREDITGRDVQQVGPILVAGDGD